MTWTNVENLLCVRLDCLGDVLMTGPALYAAKYSAGKTRRVTLLTSRSGFDAAQCLPWLDEVLVFDAPWMKASSGASSDRETMEILGGKGFDAAIIFTVYSQNPLPAAYLCYLAGISHRAAHCRENPYRLLTDWVKEIEPDECVRHEVRRQLDLVAHLGFRNDNERLQFHVPPAVRQRMRHFLPRRDRRKLVVIHPGASAPSRRYSPSGFATVADHLAQANCEIVFTGNHEENTLIADIQAMMQRPARSVAGKLSLQELGALVADADLLLTNNTGPAHVAAAVGTPVVVLYALTNPQHTPWQVPCRVLFHDVECKYCYKSVCPQGHHDCLAKVEPERVVEAVLELLAQTDAKAGGKSSEVQTLLAG